MPWIPMFIFVKTKHHYQYSWLKYIGCSHTYIYIEWILSNISQRDLKGAIGQIYTYLCNIFLSLEIWRKISGSVYLRSEVFRPLGHHHNGIGSQYYTHNKTKSGRTALVSETVVRRTMHYWSRGPTWQQYLVFIFVYIYI